MKGGTAAGEAPYSGMRPLGGVLEQNRVVHAMRAASLAEAAVDCVYTSTAGGMVTSCPVTKRTEKRVMPALRRPGRPLCADCQAAGNRQAAGDP
jgi:hypothetical protein